MKIEIINSSLLNLLSIFKLDSKIRISSTITAANWSNERTTLLKNYQGGIPIKSLSDEGLKEQLLVQNNGTIIIRINYQEINEIIYIALWKINDENIVIMMHKTYRDQLTQLLA